jgi:hypothetical protein
MFTSWLSRTLIQNGGDEDERGIALDRILRGRPDPSRSSPKLAYVVLSLHFLITF